MHGEDFNYSDLGIQYKNHLFYDNQLTQKRPAILVVHDAWGCNDVAQAKAKKLAELGYITLAVDMYGEGKTAENFPEALQLVKPLINDRELIKKRIFLAYENLLKLPFVDINKIGAIGFCFGGLTVLDLIRYGADVKAVASFHGILKPLEKHQSQIINAKVLVLHGYDDPSVPPEQVNQFAQEMTYAKVDWQIHMYGNTMHAFTNPRANDLPGGRMYNAMAEHRAWQAMENFFTEIFK